MKAELQVGHRKETSNSNRTKRAKPEDHKRKESETDRGIKICMFPDFNLFLLHEARILEFVLMTTLHSLAGDQVPREFTRDAILTSAMKSERG